MLLFLRIYAVAYLVLYVETLLFGGAQSAQHSPIQLIDLLFFTPVAVIGLWSAAYRHLNLPKNTWKILLFFSVFWRPLALGNALLSGDAIPKFQRFLAQMTANMSPDNALAITLLSTAGLCLAGSLLVVPPLIGLYRNAYGDESLLKLMSPSHVRAERPPGDGAEPLAQMAATAPTPQPEKV